MIVAFFCMPEPGHFHRLRGVIAGVAAAGHEARVYTDRRFQRWVEAAGGTFVDLFKRRPIDAADARSQPVPCRYVSFAAHFAEDVLRELRQAPPALVVYDTFAVIGRVVADALGVAGVNVCAGHNVQPEAFLERLAHDPRVDVADECSRAAEILRERYGLEDASPFSYVSALSPQLNLYCEPPEYLDPEDRAVFEPLAFFGSLPGTAPPERIAPRPDFRTRVYISFGTIVWRYFARAATDTLRGLVASFAAMPDVDVRISLGGAAIDRSGLEAPNVRVESYVDQWQVLHESDVFVTHQGLNSTHEAAFCGVPMISRPYFWDQPALAANCEALGLAVPLERGEDRDVAHSMEMLRGSRERFAESLSRARRWEEEVVARRPEVIERMLALA